MLIWLVIAAYLLGSIPFGLIVAGIWNVDIRRHGSGNIGATNVLRTLGPVPAAAVFALDFSKGLLAVYLGYWSGGGPLIVLLLGAAAVLGHMYSIFLKFKVGKGAAWRPKFSPFPWSWPRSSFMPRATFPSVPSSRRSSRPA